MEARWMPMLALQNFYLKPRFCWYRLALPELRMFIEIVLPSYDVMFKIKAYLTASFGGNSYRIRNFQLICINNFFISFVFLSLFVRFFNVCCIRVVRELTCISSLVKLFLTLSRRRPLYRNQFIETSYI